MNTPSIDEQTLWELLRQVNDPEIGCNIVDLGLVYSLNVQGTKVVAKITLTTHGCPMHESLLQGARNALLSCPAVEEAEVELVWDPPWTPEMMTDYGRACVGYRR